METSPLFSVPDHAQNAPNGKAATAVADVRIMQEVTSRFRSVQVDPAEFACLKAIVLFKPGKRNVIYLFIYLIILGDSYIF